MNRAAPTVISYSGCDVSAGTCLVLLRENATLHEPRVILLERSGAWATRLRSSLPSGVRLREVRSYPECWQELPAGAPALLAIELTERTVASAVEMLTRLERLRPHTLALALAELRLAGYEELVREAGAVHFITSRRNMQHLGELIGRYFARFPQPAIDTRADILARLPWGGTA